MTNEQEQDKRKQELKDKVYSIWKTVKEIKEQKPRNMEEGVEEIKRIIYKGNINTLREYLIDRNCQGERPKLIVESPYTNPKTGETDDVIYMPTEPKYNQTILDMLKKQQLIPEDSTKDDYDFLLRK